MLTRFLSPALGAFASTLIALPVVAQNYSYSAPPPNLDGLSGSGRVPERLAGEDDVTVYGSWDFRYLQTPDRNFFVSRIFLSDFGDASVGSVVQIDCGRVLYRHIAAPQVFDRNFSNTETESVPMDGIPVNVWGPFNDNSLGRAMMRTCEAVAQQEGLVWSWD